MSSSTAGRRILVLASTFPRWRDDGEPGFVLDLCRQLAHGTSVMVLAPHAAGAATHENLDGIAVRRFRYGPDAWEKLAYAGGIMANLRRNPFLLLMLPPFLLAQLGYLLACLRSFRPDTVHAHWIVPQGVVLALASCLVGVSPFAVCTAHGSDVLSLRGAFWARLRRWVAGRCDRVVAVSEALRNRLLREGCPAGKLAVIPMGTDLQGRFHPDATLRRTDEILFVGRLVADKGCEFLIRALPRIRAGHPGVTLTIVGDGPERVRLEALCRSLELADAVCFAGAVSHAGLPAYYRRAALLAMPSLSEGFGLVLVEAMGCGCPVAASDLPATRALLGEGGLGRLFAPGDPDALAAAVGALLGDAAACEAMAKSARERALSRYDWQIIGREYLAALAQDK